jgi:integrin beta 3
MPQLDRREEEMLTAIAALISEYEVGVKARLDLFEVAHKSNGLNTEVKAIRSELAAIESRMAEELAAEVNDMLERQLLDHRQALFDAKVKFTQMAERVAALVAPQGEPGRDGEKGERGEAGEKGERGERGERGEKGDPGERGEPGEKGDDGLRGAPGESVQGERGPVGERGERGLPGERGEPGITGEQGIPGNVGPRGAQGEKGERGSTGSEGAPGRDGAQGERGAIGPVGRDGTDGQAGAPGAAGKDGSFHPPRAYRQGAVHYAREVILCEGSTWIAERDTAQAPPHEDWVLVAARGEPAKQGRILGLHDPELAYLELDRVVKNGSEWLALKDDPGELPGEGWLQVSRAGSKGAPGPRGEKGERGAKGEQGQSLVIEKIEVNGYGITLFQSNGKPVAFDMRGVFERYDTERSA